MKLFELTKIPILGKALDAYALRQRVTADNLANVNTVGYRAKAVLFEEELQKAAQPASVKIAATHEHHLVPQSTSTEEVKVVDAAAEGKGTTDPVASGANDVDVDIEMATLADTQLRFKFASRLIAETFKGIQKSIRGQV